MTKKVKDATTGINRINGHDDPADPPAGRQVLIRPPNFQVASFLIRGVAPYVQNKFSEKAKRLMQEAQEAGSLAKRKGKVKEPKDFDEAYRSALHVARDGWAGIPSVAFFKALVSACRMVDFKMTVARQALYVIPDGWSRDPADRSGLTRITKGEPARFDALVRLQLSTTDIRVRPLWEPGWEATVRVRFDADLFDIRDVANLLMRAGYQVGVGEGRPDSPSGGQGWGLFELVQGADPEAQGAQG